MRVLAVYELGRGGTAVLDRARELALSGDADLTVVGVAPQAPTGARCGGSALEINDAVAESVEEDLARARRQLGVRATYQMLIENREPSLERFASDGDFELVLLPGRRRVLRGARHPAAARLGRATAAAIEVVSRGGAGGTRALPG
jgi:nucleotide-binding universal stress UspA family protein